MSVPGPLRFVPHPISDRAWWDLVGSDPRWRAWREDVLARAAAAPREPRTLSCVEWLSCRRRNDRSPGDRYVEQARGQMAALIIRRCLQGPGEDDQLLDWLWAQATEPSWRHQTHCDMDLPRLGAPDLDLMGCEQAAFLAEAVEVLRPWLEGQSPALALDILDEVDRKVLTPYGQGAEVWWERRINNWIGVCGGALLAACRSSAAQGRPHPKAEARALAALATYLDAGFTPNGECAEGIGYWHYGMVMAQLGLTRLDPAELPTPARLALVGGFPRRCHLGGEVFLSWNDSGHHTRAAVALVPWLARQTGDAWLWAWARRSPSWGNRHLGGLLREAEALAWLGPDPALALPVAPDAWLADQQVATVVSGTLVAAITGGANDESHNHNDLGHVSLLRDGRFVIPDLGAPKPYPADFFGPGRYGYLAAASAGHSVPIIGGREQVAGAAARAMVVSQGADGCALDLTAAYPVDSGLRRYVRTLAQAPAGLVVEDRITAAPGTPVEHRLWMAEPDFGGTPVAVQPPAAPEDVVVDPAANNLPQWRYLAVRRWRFTVPASGDLLLRTTLG